MSFRAASSLPVRRVALAGLVAGLAAIHSDRAIVQAQAASIAFVQRNYSVPQSPQTTVTVPYAGAQTAGNFNVVVIGWSDSTAQVQSVGDTKGNAYVKAVGPTVQTGVATQSIYYAAQIVAAAAGSNSVTITFTTAAAYPDVRIAEYSGIDPVNPLDVVAGATGSTTTSNSGAIATTNANDLLVGANLVQTFTSAAGSGYTSRAITSPDGDILEDRVVSAIGSYSATASLSSAGAWIMQLAAFRAASANSDTQPPTAPANLTATAASGSQINLTWTASTDNVGVTGYSVERCQNAGCTNFVPVGSATAAGYSDTGLSASTSYSYRVRATDAAGNLSAYSNTATATTATPTDTQPPTPPANLAATASSTSQINLAWTASTDNVGVTGYSVERCQNAGCTNFVPVASATAASYNDTGLSGSTSYSYRVRATDAAGNLSAYSNTATATTATPTDTQPPTTPANLTATASSASQINLTWTPSTDNVGVTGYSVERCQNAACTNFVAVGNATAASYSDTGLLASTSYSYRVRATDAAGNLSTYSNTATATTQAGAPATITYRQSNYTTPQSAQTTVSVQFTGAQTSGDLNVVAIGWANSTSHVASVTDTSGNSYAPALAATVQSNIQSQVIYFAAGIGAAGANANTVRVTFDQAASYPDVRIAEYGGIDPANPVDRAVGGSGTGTTSNSGTVATTNSSDLLLAANNVQTTTSGAGSGFTSRVITNPDGNILEDRVVATTGSYSATAPLSGSGAWTMQLVAFRAAPAAPPDTQPPTVPANLTATASSGSQIDLSWTASTDNVAVTGYRVERCQGAGCSNFAQIGSTSTTSFSDTGLLGSTTYKYQVRATDGTNFSGYSNTATATTPQGPSLSVSITTPTPGAPLSGTVNFGATASGDGIGGVQFLVDGVNVGWPAAAPYYISFDTSQFPNGSHTVTAYTWDRTRQIATSAPVAVTFSNSTPGTPAQTGLWSGLLSWPGFVSVHINLLRDGRVLAWDRMSTGNPDPQIFDPVTSILTPVPTSDGTNLFCDGHVTLPDGRVFSAGGHQSDHVGIPAGRIFDPLTNQWTSTPDMSYGRWYPTTTALPDGRILTLSGEVNCKGCDARIPEIYDPVRNSWTQLTGASLLWPFYPHSYVLPDGRIVVAATTESPAPTRVLNLSTQTWSVVDSRSLDAYSSAMYLPGKILKSGTSTDSDTKRNSASTAYVLDMTAATPSWRQIASMASARAYHVLTILPDGNVLVTGGGRTTGDYDIPNAVYAAELWSPTTEKWTTLSSMHAPRLYHGTALLLADGRVLVSGGGRSPGPSSLDQENAEIFAPPYLFKGPRPAIASAPAQLGYNQTFVVQTPDAGRIAKVALVGIGNMTHGLNMNQRYLPLNFTAGSGSLTVTAPANQNLAPPGYYLLFIVDSAGVPSVASFVRF